MNFILIFNSNAILFYTWRLFPAFFPGFWQMSFLKRWCWTRSTTAQWRWIGEVSFKSMFCTGSHKSVLLSQQLWKTFYLLNKRKMIIWTFQSPKTLKIHDYIHQHHYQHIVLYFGSNDCNKNVIIMDNIISGWG